MDLPFVVKVKSNKVDNNWFFIYTRSRYFLLTLAYILTPSAWIFLSGGEYSLLRALFFCALAAFIIVTIYSIDYLNFRAKMKKVDSEGEVTFHADSYQIKYSLGEVTQKYETLKGILLYKHLLILDLGHGRIFLSWKNVPEEKIEELKFFLTSLNRPSRSFTY